MFLNKPMIVLLYNEAFLNTNEIDSALPSSVVSLLQEYDDVGDDLRTNPFQEEGNDENRNASTKDPLQVPVGPITRARAKKFKAALNGFIQGLWADSNCKMDSNKNLELLNLIQADGGPSQT